MLFLFLLSQLSFAETSFNADTIDCASIISEFTSMGSGDTSEIKDYCENYQFGIISKEEFLKVYNEAKTALQNQNTPAPQEKQEPSIEKEAKEPPKQEVVQKKKSPNITAKLNTPAIVSFAIAGGGLGCSYVTYSSYKETQTTTEQNLLINHACTIVSGIAAITGGVMMFTSK